MTQTTQAHPDHSKQIPIPLGKGDKRQLQTIVTTRPGTDFSDEKNPPRSYCFFIRTYLPQEAIRELLPECKAWAFILHDKDDKHPHHHLLLGYQNQHTLTSVAGKLLKVAKMYPVNGHPQASFIEIPYSKSRCFAYLTHSDPESQKAGKHVYSDAEVLCENADYFDDNAQYNSKTRFNVVEVLDSINQGTPYREMATKFGASFVCNYGRFKGYAQAMYHEERHIATDRLGQALRDYADGNICFQDIIHVVLEKEAYEAVFKPLKNVHEQAYRLRNTLDYLQGLADHYQRILTDFRSIADDQEKINDLSRCVSASTTPLSPPAHHVQAQREQNVLNVLPIMNNNTDGKLNERKQALIESIKEA